MICISIPSRSASKSVRLKSRLPSRPSPRAANWPRSRRLLQIQYPPVSNARILSRVRRRLMKTNQCPLVGSSPRCRRTRADKPSNEQRMSVGAVQSQMRAPGAGFSMAASFALEELRHRRAPAPHPTTAREPARPAQLPQTSTRHFLRVAQGLLAVYASTNRTYSATDRGRNKRPCGSARFARTVKPTPATRSPCVDGNEPNRSISP